MFRNYLLLLLLTVGLFTLPGCSLFSSDSEDGEEAVTEETVSEDGDDVLAADDMSSSDVSESTETFALSDEEEVMDDYPDDDYGGEATASSDMGTSEETLYVSGDESTSDDSGYGYSSDESTSTASYSDNLSDGSAPAFIPVKKMKRTPYNEGGVLINRLYIARQGDTMSGIAEKVYGDSSRSKDLLAWNGHFRGKSLKVGDKVYYSSARNPSDNSQILLYYEEAGIQPSIYTAQQGDSIRKVSENLLGHPRSWMEIWATNEVESKWQMPAGTNLRYWPDGTSAPAPMQLQAAAPQPTPSEEMPQEEYMDNDSMAANNMAGNADDMGGAMPAEEFPPDDMGDDMGAAAQVAQNDAPPPPPPDMQTPPPPPPSDAMAPPEAPRGEEGGLAGMMGGQDDSTMIAILGGLLLVAAFILLIFLKRGRKKATYS